MVIMIGCSNYSEPSNKINIAGETTIQGCEYFVVVTSYSYYVPVHKGNCKNPIHYKMCDSTKFIDRLEKDSMKIKFLEMKLEVLEKVNNSLSKSSKHENH